MTRMMITTGAILLGLAMTATQSAAGPLDRLEDRIDRRESVIDRRVDNGPLDRLEDRIDRRESIADRRGREFTPRIDRHERRSWRRLRGSHEG